MTGMMFARTVFIYIEETCNGEKGEFLSDARDGIFEVLFDQGHIVFDNGKEGIDNDIITRENLSSVIFTAQHGGAEYLIAVSIASEKEELPGKKFRIYSTGEYFVFNVDSGELLFKGTAEFSNKGRESDISLKQCGLFLGRDIAEKSIPVIVSGK